MKAFTESVFSVLLAALSADSLRAAPNYTVVDTGQTKCYDNRNEISPPKPGQPFYGQDAQFHHHPSSYTLGEDGRTVHDNITGLTWQRSPDTDGDGVLTRHDKLSLSQAQAVPAKLNAAKFGGFDDWRLPTIKELYSLFDARGTDPSGPGGNDTSSLTPFINTKYFQFAYGDTRTGDIGLADLNVFSVRDQQDVVERNFRVLGPCHELDFEHVAGLDAILFGTCSNDCVHGIILSA